MSRFCPVTNHYRCDDGKYLLVTIAALGGADIIDVLTSRRIPVKREHLPTHADVFLADADAVPIDADGNPANGLTPLMRIPGCDSFTDALAAAGYHLQEKS